MHRNTRGRDEAILKATEEFGPVRIHEKRTSIHLGAKTAFAGVHPQKASLVLTVRSAAAIDSPRVNKAEQVSANRWHKKLSGPSEVDRELIGWLKAAYALSTT